MVRQALVRKAMEAGGGQGRGRKSQWWANAGSIQDQEDIPGATQVAAGPWAGDGDPGGELMLWPCSWRSGEGGGIQGPAVKHPLLKGNQLWPWWRSDARSNRRGSVAPTTHLSPVRQQVLLPSHRCFVAPTVLFVEHLLWARPPASC